MEASVSLLGVESAEGHVLDRRRRRVRICRAYFPLAVASFVAVPIAGLYIPGTLLAVVIAAAVLGAGLVAVLEGGSGVEGDLVFADMMPFACLWDATRLGAFGPADIVSARVVRDRAQGYAAVTSLRIQSKQGGVTTLGGYLDLTDKDFDQFGPGRAPNPAYSELLREKDHKAREEFSRGVEWLSTHGVALGLSTPREERLRARRIARVIVAGVVVAAPSALLAIVALAQVGVLTGWNADSAVMIWALLFAISTYLPFVTTNEGLAVSGDVIYRPRVTLGILDRSGTLGAEPPSAVASWTVRRASAANHNLGRQVLEVRFRGGGKGVLGDFTDETRFAEVQKWLEARCPSAKRAAR